MNKTKNNLTMGAPARPISNGMNKKFLASILSLCIFFALGASMVQAICPPDCGTSTGAGGNSGTNTGEGSNTNRGEGSGSNPGEGGGTNQNIGIKIPNPFRGGATNLFELLSTIVDDILIPIGGVISVLAFIWAGFLYVTAQGKESQIKDAHRAFLYTAVGTAVLLGSWVLSSGIYNTINQLK